MGELGCRTAATTWHIAADRFMMDCHRGAANCSPPRNFAIRFKYAFVFMQGIEPFFIVSLYGIGFRPYTRTHK